MQSGASFDRWITEADLDEDEQFQPPRPFWRRPALIVTAVIILIVAIGGGLFLSRHSGSAAPVYRYGAVTTGDLTVAVTATGPVGSQVVYNLNFPTSARLTEIDVTVGQVVQAGQLLAKIDTTALQDAVNQARASLNSANVNYNNALLNLKDVKAQNNPCPTQATPPAASKTQAQCTQAIDQAQQQVNTALAQVQSAKVQLQTAQDNMTSGGLTAPAAGTIVSINGTVGSVTGGGNASSALIVLEDLNQLSIVAQVNEADISSVKVGQSARFTVAAYPSDTFHGSVTAISLIGQTTSNVVTYNVTVSVDQNSLNGVQLLPGMTASLSITTQQRIGVVLVPNTAISFARTLLTNGQLDRTQVRNLLATAATQTANGQTPQGTASFVVEMKNGKLTPVLIFTGLSSGASTEVISGLADGDQVLTGQVNPSGTTTTTTGGGGFGGGIFGGGGGGGNGGGRGGNGGG
ncbi:MAG TPA: efflux RND transporter periplasmic adaptor subunit [Ktedonobacterales bacterium]|jgi:RND family efflux transporter MFP subunit